jgi:hypothetical protein
MSRSASSTRPRDVAPHTTGGRAERRHRRRRKEPVPTATRRHERSTAATHRSAYHSGHRPGAIQTSGATIAGEHRQRGPRRRVDAAAARQRGAAAPRREHEERRRREAQRHVPDQPERHAGSFGRWCDPARQRADEIGSEHDADDRDRCPEDAWRTLPHAPHDEKRGEEQRRGRERQRGCVRGVRASLGKEVHRRVEQARASRELAQRHDGDAPKDDEHRTDGRERAPLAPGSRGEERHERDEQRHADAHAGPLPHAEADFVRPTARWPARRTGAVQRRCTEARPDRRSRWGR